MTSCPACRTKYDPTFTPSCPECEGESHAVVDDHPVLGAPKRRFTHFATGIAIRLVIGAAVFGASAVWGAISGSDEPVAAQTPPATTAPGTELVAAEELAVGDCIMWPDDDMDFAVVERRLCAMSHDAEMFGQVMHPAPADAAFPGEDELMEWSAYACKERFADYVGLSYEDATNLEFSFFTPTELGWRKLDDRTVQCVVHQLDDEPMTGTVRLEA